MLYESVRIRISTHSLTRRLTRPELHPAGIYSHFNSQPHKEADRPFWLLPERELYFNSQPHKEADQRKPGHAVWSYHFNSQPHKEADGIHRHDH